MIVAFDGGVGRARAQETRTEAAGTISCAASARRRFQLLRACGRADGRRGDRALERDRECERCTRDAAAAAAANTERPAVRPAVGPAQPRARDQRRSRAPSRAPTSTSSAPGTTRSAAPAIVVADIDSGYRLEQPDLGAVEWTNPGEIAGNGVDDDDNGYVDDVHGWDFVGARTSTRRCTPSADNDATDDDLFTGGHGVHTAGTIGAAGNNGRGITGVAQNVRIMPLRVCSYSPDAGADRLPDRRR